MLRFTTILMTFALAIGCFKDEPTNTLVQDSKAPSQRKPEPEELREWREIAKNHYYLLHEYRESDDKSIYSATIFELDAQLGLGIFLDISMVAESRGFKYIRVLVDEIVPEHPSELDGNLESQLPDEYRLWTTHSVSFLMDEPADDKNVFKVSEATFIAKQRGGNDSSRQLENHPDE